MRLVGFLAFNPASTFSITSGEDLVMAHASATTLLAAAGAGLGGQGQNMTQFMMHRFLFFSSVLEVRIGQHWAGLAHYQWFPSTSSVFERCGPRLPWLTISYNYSSTKVGWSDGLTGQYAKLLKFPHPNSIVHCPQSIIFHHGSPHLSSIFSSSQQAWLIPWPALAPRWCVCRS